MGYVQNLHIVIENARFEAVIDKQVAKFRKETREMRKQEDELRAQRLIKNRREAIWVNKPEALTHLQKP